MASINIDLNYLDHPKTKRLIGRLGRGAEVLPIRLWIYCGRVHMRDGKLTGYTAPEIEQLLDWWGKAGEAVKALVDVQYLRKIDGGYECHEWDEYQGHIYAYHIRARKGAKAKHAIMRGDDNPASSSASSSHEASVKQCHDSPVHVSSEHPPKAPHGGQGGKRLSRQEREQAERDAAYERLQSAARTEKIA